MNNNAIVDNTSSEFLGRTFYIDLLGTYRTVEEIPITVNI